MWLLMLYWNSIHVSWVQSVVAVSDLYVYIVSMQALGFIVSVHGPPLRVFPSYI